jgi:pilus assembly protein Flp/PilA
MRIIPGENGQGILEYALIFVLVILVVIIVLYLFGPAINSWYAEIVQSI